MNRAKQEDTPWMLMRSTGARDSFVINWHNEPRGNGGVTYIKTALSFAGGFEDVLAKLDFNEAVSLAKTVNRKPLSLLAQATVCRRAIESIQKEAPKAQTGGVSSTPP